jgi:CubicO group peptidase (beta-lactamase class C family)
MMARAPFLKRTVLILTLLALPALSACGSDEPAAQVRAPLSPAAKAAIVGDPGVDRETLARAIDDLFTDEQAGQTRAVVAMRGGRIVAERYGPGFDKDTRFLGWSLTKCVTGVMIGALVSDGRLRLDETAPVPAWQRSGDPRGEITLRQLLQMRSGLRHSEGAEPVYASDEVRMLFLDGRDAMAAYAEAQPLESEPGREFEYSSATSVILADLAARVLTDSSDPAVRREVVAGYLRHRLFEPAGMMSMTPEFDRRGTFVGSSMLHATARDWARVGEFLRNDGSVKGAQIVPRAWIEFMKRASPRNPAYGAHLWRNRPSSDGGDHLFPGQAADDVFGCLGHLGQFVVVSPGQKLTLVRLGHSSREEQRIVRKRLLRIITLFPQNARN